MIVFLLMFTQLGEGIRRSWRDPGFRGLLVLLASLLAMGTWFYHRIEGWSWVDSLYFSVVAISTVGFGDFSPQTTAGKLFTIVFLLSGIGIWISIVGTVAVNLARMQTDVGLRYRHHDRRDAGEDHPEEP